MIRIENILLLTKKYYGTLMSQTELLTTTRKYTLVDNNFVQNKHL